MAPDSPRSWSGPEAVRVARHAMATRFEILLYGDRPEALRAAGEEALDEVERIENTLSLYRPHTDVARINTSASRGPVRVSPETLQLLGRARALTHQTQGAFDITAGPLVRAWGFHGASGGVPAPGVLDAARRASGWSRVILDPRAGTVRFSEGTSALMDLGAIGKGYALDRASEVLREAGVTSALLHGGTSTIVALGKPPNSDGWVVALTSDPAVETPNRVTGSPSPDPNRVTGTLDASGPPAAVASEGQAPLRSVVTLRNEPVPKSANRVTGSTFHDVDRVTGSLYSPVPSAMVATDGRAPSRTFITLRDESLSVSAVWGRAFEDPDGRTLGHVVDPRTGFPVTGARLAAVALPSATESDAVSTALLVLGSAGIPWLTSQFEGLRCWLDPDAEPAG